MRALVCDWCGAVTTSREGWYEVQAASASRHAAFEDTPRSFCGLDCMADFVDDARTSPTGEVTGAAPLPVEVELAAVEAAEPVPAVEPIAKRAAVLGLALTGPHDDAESADEPEVDAAVDAIAEVEPPLRGLGRGLGRTGS